MLIYVEECQESFDPKTFEGRVLVKLTWRTGGAVVYLDQISTPEKLLEVISKSCLRVSVLNIDEAFRQVWEQLGEQRIYTDSNIYLLEQGKVQARRNAASVLFSELKALGNTLPTILFEDGRLTERPTREVIAGVTEYFSAPSKIKQSILLSEVDRLMKRTYQLSVDEALAIVNEAMPGAVGHCSIGELDGKPGITLEYVPENPVEFLVESMPSTIGNGTNEEKALKALCYWSSGNKHLFAEDGMIDYSAKSTIYGSWNRGDEPCLELTESALEQFVEDEVVQNWMAEGLVEAMSSPVRIGSGLVPGVRIPAKVFARYGCSV